MWPSIGSRTIGTGSGCLDGEVSSCWISGMSMSVPLSFITFLIFVSLEFEERFEFRSGEAILMSWRRSSSSVVLFGASFSKQGVRAFILRSSGCCDITVEEAFRMASISRMFVQGCSDLRTLSVITENGCSWSDEPFSSGKVELSFGVSGESFVFMPGWTVSCLPS